VTREDVDSWLDAYVEAWLTYDRDQVEALFAEDIAYRYHPYDDPIEGRDAVIESWLEAGESSDASSRDDAVATGSSSYRDEPSGEIKRTYDNCFVMRFDAEGRCREFTEWFMQRKSP
jgi:hypothetical protein